VAETGTEILVRWWNTLNTWQWPEDMPGKWENFDTLPRYTNSEDDSDQARIVHERQKAIELLLGGGLTARKACMHYKLTKLLGKSDVEFEMWWAQHYGA
jgi:hypothetical protein